MSEKAEIQRNVWTLTVLCLLREAPMHPYEMQRLIHERKKDELLDLKRASLPEYRPARASRSDREGRNDAGRESPECTVYRLTNAGEAATCCPGCEIFWPSPCKARFHWLFQSVSLPTSRLKTR